MASKYFVLFFFLFEAIIFILIAILYDRILKNCELVPLLEKSPEKEYLFTGKMSVVTISKQELTYSL